MRASSSPTLVAVVLLLSACGRADAPRPVATSATPVTAEESAKTPSSGAPWATPLFTYEEGGSSLSFSESGALRLVVVGEAGTRTCDSELGDKGNMWTRDDVRSAFDHLDVQKALSDGELYRSAYPSPARLAANGKTVTWVIAWKELPPSEPEAVHHLHEVLHGVLGNRLSLCP
jgi:hypothetical protein